MNSSTLVLGLQVMNSYLHAGYVGQVQFSQGRARLSFNHTIIMPYSVSAKVLVIHKLKGINQPHMQPTAHCTCRSKYKKGSYYTKSYKIQHGKKYDR